MITHLRPPRATSCLEILESRIAPAVFYVSPNIPATVHKDGIDPASTQTGDATAATAAGATLAIPLAKGDTLVFDADNSGTISTGDTTLLKVTAGRALSFLTDFSDGAGGATADLKFEKNELTGVAVSNAFAGSGSSVSGAIVTALDDTGAFTSGANSAVTLLHTSLASLTMEGAVSGGLLAGGAISKVRADSLGVAATGTAANGRSFSLNGGAQSLSASFVQTANGEAGGSISEVTVLTAGAGFFAGNGADIATGKAGAGGAIVNVSVLASSTGYSASAGRGGNATTSGTGGAGGSLSGSFTMSPAAGDDLSFSAGGGGSSTDGAGGAGGSLLKTTVHTLTPARSLNATAGDGGVGGNKGSGGQGGGFLMGDRILLADLTQDLHIRAGDGGLAGLNGGTGGAGGALAGLIVNSQALGTGNSLIRSGHGADGFTKGGAGGAVGLDFISTGSIGRLDVSTGNGGDGLAFTATGGSAGTLSGSIKLASIGTVNTVGSINVTGGIGGDAPARAPGVGGSISKFTLVNGDTVPGNLFMGGGSGGNQSAGDSRLHRAGAGGGVSNVSLTNTGTLAGFEIASGKGGNVLVGSGTTGNSGAVSMVTVKNDGLATGVSSIHSGSGGFHQFSTGHGGDSGKVSAVTINDTLGAATTFEIYAGGPISNSGGIGKTSMAGSGAGGHGGNIGDVSGVSLNKTGGSPNSKFLIGRPIGAGDGGTGSDAQGGKGGAITNITGLVGTLDILAGAGGRGLNSNNVIQGSGGAGGSISNVTVHTSGAGHFVHLIAAGDGGDGNFAAGAGGSVTGVKVLVDAAGDNRTGNIGDVTKTFGLTTDASLMGGLVAGKRGNGSGKAVNGSISNIDVGTHTIAAILAGRPAANAINVANAVTKISGIKAGALGADTGLPGTASDPGTKPGTIFDFDDGSSADGVFMPDTASVTSGDRAIDGFVLVKTGGITLPAGLIPLLLLKV